MAKYAYMTVLTNDYYLNGTVALKRCLDDVNSRFPLFVLIPKGRSDLGKLLDDYDISYIEDELIDISFEIENSDKYRYWGQTFFKLVIMRQTQWDKIVMLDSDLLINENIDSLFEMPHMSAVVSGGYLHHEYKKLNSGVIVIEPSDEEYQRLLQGIEPAYVRRKSLDLSCGDQDVFHYVWSDWEDEDHLKLSETYNTYIHDAGKMAAKTGAVAKVVHFTGARKPWSYNIIDDMLTFVFRSIIDGNFVRFKMLKKYENYCRLKKRPKSDNQSS